MKKDLHSIFLLQTLLKTLSGPRNKLHNLELMYQVHESKKSYNFIEFFAINYVKYAWPFNIHSYTHLYLVGMLVVCLNVGFLLSVLLSVLLSSDSISFVTDIITLCNSSLVFSDYF